MPPFRVLFLSAEVAPFAKMGGLADVGGSLPKALAALGHDVRVVMPAYSNIEAALLDGSLSLEALPSIDVPMGFGLVPAGVLKSQLPGSRVPIYFITEGSLFNRPATYGYKDDPYRFSFFSRAALHLANVLDWRIDILHAHDWHTAPAVTWLATTGQVTDFFRHTPSLFTIHNLAHQGRAPWGVFDYLGISTYRLNDENFNQVNFMARGIHHATLVNTVSPTYAREIMTPEGGAGLDGLLRNRAYDVHGILNGLDYDVWNPEKDIFLAQNYNSKILERRMENKLALQARAGLEVNANIPLVAMISRLDWQKGLDITGHVIHLLMNNSAGPAQFILLGSGDPQYHEMLDKLGTYHRSKMAVYFGYENELSHLIYGGSDIFLMPSLFEPCGLSQLISMRYGCVPVVRATGGLADTVQDGVTGYTFFEYSSEALWQALQRAIHIFRADPKSWLTIQRQGMQEDFSWSRSAGGYQQLYDWAIARVQHEAGRV